MLKFLKTFFEHSVHKTLSSIHDYSNNYLYISEEIKNKLLEEISTIAHKIFDKDIKIVYRPLDELNEYESDDTKWAAGKFIWKTSDHQITYENYLLKYNLLKPGQKYSDEVPDDLVFPRIELSNSSHAWTFLHELGHYNIYLKKENQSEELADLYIIEFIEKYMPPFFKWIFQIRLSCYLGDDLVFTKDEANKHYCDFLVWLDENNEFSIKTWEQIQ